MTRHALLIGSETYGLSGCNADVALMRDVLGARGFDTVDARTGADASRAGILDGLATMLGAITKPDDAVVLYYSGHGGRVARPDFEERKAARRNVYFQFVVPFDMEESTPGDFRGLLSEELTWHQRQLTDAFLKLGAVPNVTTILDCCHSGYMARAIETVPKAVDLDEKMFRMRGILDHALALAAELELEGLATNPHAVRLAACQPEQSAYEFPSARGGRHGALTDALASVIEELGEAAVSWSMVGELVRRRVRALVPEQRPDVEGPSDRLLFSDRSFPTANTYAISTVDDDVRIESAVVLGIEVGDEFRLVIPGRDDALGVGVVERIEGGAAVLRIDPDDARDEVSKGALALPSVLRRPKAQVHVDVAEASALRERLAAHPLLTEASDTTAVMVGITSATDGLVLNDEVGERWRVDSYTNDDAGLDRLIGDIEAIGVGHRLLDLASGDAANALDPVVTIEFGSVANGTRTPAPLQGQRFPAGTSLYVSLTNTSTEPVFVWVFDVGVSGRSALLTNAAPSGTMLGPTGAENDSDDLWDHDGEQLTWPGDVPTTTSAGTAPGRWERFAVVVADQRGDLSSLASRRSGARSVPRSPLEAVMNEARTGMREIGASEAAAAPLRYRIDTIEFLLEPG